MTEPQHYAYRFTTDDGHGNTITSTRRTVGWENLDTLVTRGIDRYGWREVEYWEVDSLGLPVDPPRAAEDDGPYCYCGHSEDRHGQGEDGNECWGCRDDEYAAAPTTHEYREAS